MDFSGKTILVVGASSGMGRGLCLRLAAEGAIIAATSRRKPMLDDLVAEIVASGGKALALPVDATDEHAAAGVVAATTAQLGGIDLVVLNAGGAPALDMRTMDAASVKAVMHSNYDTVVNYLFPVLAHMKQRGRGTVVHTNSLAGFIGVPLQGPYSAAKAAARLLLDTCRIEFAEFGINFVSLYPGFVATEATRGDGMPAPGEISEQEAVEHMMGAMRREDWDYMFPQAAGANIMHAMTMKKADLNLYLRKRILEARSV